MVLLTRAGLYEALFLIHGSSLSHSYLEQECVGRVGYPIATVVISFLRCLHKASLRACRVSMAVCVLFFTLFCIALIVLVACEQSASEMSVHVTAGSIDTGGSGSVLGNWVFLLTLGVVL